MSRRANSAVLWVLGIALLIFLVGAGTFLGRGLYDLGGNPNAHHITSFGQNWTVTIPVGTSQGSAAGCTATSGLSGVGFTGSIRNSGNQCLPQSVNGQISLDSVDLKNVRHAVIGRSCMMSVGEAGSNGASITSAVQGVNEPNIVNGDLVNGRNAAASTSDIYVDNDGSVLTIRSGGLSATLDGTTSRNLLVSTAVSSNGIGDLSCVITGLNITTPTIPQPSLLPSPSFTTVLAGILDWIVGFFQKLYGYDIGGPTTVTAGTTQTYHVNMTSPYPLQNDSTQGVFMQRWCDTGLINRNGTVVSETGFNSCGDQYTATPSFTLPSGTLQDYAVVAVMVETRQDYLNGSWSTTYSQRVIQKESLTITDRILSSPTSNPAPNGITGFLTTIWTWLRSLWPF